MSGPNQDNGVESLYLTQLVIDCIIFVITIAVYAYLVVKFKSALWDKTRVDRFDLVILLVSFIAIFSRFLFEIVHEEQSIIPYMANISCQQVIMAIIIVFECEMLRVRLILSAKSHKDFVKGMNKISQILYICPIAILVIGVFQVLMHLGFFDKEFFKEHEVIVKVFGLFIVLIKTPVDFTIIFVFFKLAKFFNDYRNSNEKLD